MAAAAASTPQQQPSFGQARQWVPSLPTSLIASLNPFASAQPKDTTDAQQNGDNQRSALSLIAQDSGPPSPTKSSVSIMFAEPESQGTSLSGSREGSIDGKRRAKRNNKPKSTYTICHPPPASSARQKLHRRPRSLLQLHKVVPNSRPLPAYEIIPSANFSVRLTRATTKVFRAKHSLCPNDLVVLRAEDYYSEEPEEDQEARDIVALICKGRKEDGSAAGKAKICMVDGGEWEAYPSVNGGYEFFTTDEHGLGLTVRWVPKKSKKEGGAKPESRRFNFSTISANTRRHPIIAHLSKSTLDIYDSYKMPDLSMVTPTATPKQQATILEDGLDSDDNVSSKQEIRRTDSFTRSIITMTSIYVAFKEGWSPYFKYDDQAPSSRRNSIHTPLSTPPASPAPNIAVLDKRSSILSVSSSLFRKSSQRTNRSGRTPTFSALDQTTNATDDIPTRSASIKASGRARADSNSTVLVHRAASNRRNTRSQATWRPELLSANKQNEMRETSREGTPVAEVKPSPYASRNPSTATGMGSRRASVLPDPDPEPESESEVEESYVPTPVPVQHEVAERHVQGTRASSNATSDSGAPKKPVVQARLAEKKSKKWKRWIRGKF
jgi:hypothetical protein